MKKKPTSLRRSMFMRLGFNFYDVAVTRTLHDADSTYIGSCYHCCDW